MDLNGSLISVVIPAYNQNVYLRRALQSVVDQVYRPIEVIVADDCSPTLIEPVVKEFDVFQNERFTVRYFRQPQNRGVMDNFRFAVGLANGKFLVPLPHDNRFIERNFLAESVRIMSDHSDCHLCYGNGIYENKKGQALNIPEAFKFCEGWSIVEGKDFIRAYRRGGMGFSQAMVLDHEMAMSLKAYDEPFVINGALSRRIGIAQDDAFSYVFILSGMGAVAVCKKLVCEIGVSSESYSRSSQIWKDTRSKVKFVVFYNIYKADFKGKYTPDMKQAAFKQAVEYIDCIVDYRIAKYYNWSAGIILLMGRSLARSAWNGLRCAFKRGVNVIRPNTFRKTKKKTLHRDVGN